MISRETIIVLFFFFLPFLGVSQRNEVSVWANYTGNHYGHVFGDWGWWNPPDRSVINRSIGNALEITQSPSTANNGSYRREYYTYHNFGLSYRRDSIFGTSWFGSIRVDNFKMKIKVESWNTGPGNANILSKSSTTRSSMMYTIGGGKYWEWDFLGISLGAEIPFYNRHDAEYQLGYSGYDKNGNRIFESYYDFYPGGYFSGISLALGVSVELIKELSLRIEGSGGWIYIRKTHSNFDHENESRFTYHYPSLGLSWKF